MIKGTEEDFVIQSMEVESAEYNRKEKEREREWVVGEGRERLSRKIFIFCEFNQTVSFLCTDLGKSISDIANSMCI